MQNVSSVEAFAVNHRKTKMLEKTRNKKALGIDQKNESCKEKSNAVETKP
jgi:hypothetical protein